MLPLSLVLVTVYGPNQLLFSNCFFCPDLVTGLFNRTWSPTLMSGFLFLTLLYLLLYRSAFLNCAFSTCYFASFHARWILSINVWFGDKWSMSAGSLASLANSNLNGDSLLDFWILVL